jgi:hypothetical protein
VPFTESVRILSRVLMAYTQEPIQVEVEVSNDDASAANVVAFEKFWDLVIRRLLNQNQLEDQNQPERQAA